MKLSVEGRIVFYRFLFVAVGLVVAGIGGFLSHLAHSSGSMLGAVLAALPLALGFYLIFRGLTASGDPIRKGVEQHTATLKDAEDQTSKLIVTSEFGRARPLTAVDFLPVFVGLGVLLFEHQDMKTLYVASVMCLAYFAFMQRRRLIRYHVVDGVFIKTNFLIPSLTKSFKLARVRGYDTWENRGTRRLRLFDANGKILISVDLDGHDLTRLEEWAEKNLVPVSTFFAA